MIAAHCPVPGQCSGKILSSWKPLRSREALFAVRAVPSVFSIDLGEAPVLRAPQVWLVRKNTFFAARVPPATGRECNRNILPELQPKFPLKSP